MSPVDDMFRLSNLDSLFLNRNGGDDRKICRPTISCYQIFTCKFLFISLENHKPITICNSKSNHASKGHKVAREL